MPDGLEAILRLVAEGRLSAEEAAPIVAALEAAEGGERGTPAAEAGRPEGAPRTSRIARQVRIEVADHGRPVVNLRVPMALSQAALDLVPTLARDNAARLRQALERGTIGPILDVRDEDGDGVRIVLE
jgi:hypothetical protein